MGSVTDKYDERLDAAEAVVREVLKEVNEELGVRKGEDAYSLSTYLRDADGNSIDDDGNLIGEEAVIERRTKVALAHNLTSALMHLSDRFGT